MSIFVDSSVWYASFVVRDIDNARAKLLLRTTNDHVTSDHVVVETSLLLNSRFHKDAGENFWDRIRRSPVRIEHIVAADLEATWAIGQAFSDQHLSIVDRTSFALMERLGIFRATSFEQDFAIYRYGRNRDRAFEILR